MIDRRGTTLVEAMVMGMVALVLAGVMWFLFSGGMRHYRSTDTKLKGVQGAQLLVEHLQDDFDRICWDETHPVTGAGQDGPESLYWVSFFTYEKTAKPGKLQPTPIATPVTYRYDPESRQVSRNDKPFLFSRFAQVRFKYQAANSKDPFRGGDPKNPQPNSLLYWVSAASDEKLSSMEETPDTTGSGGGDRRGITTLFGVIHLRAQAAAHHFPGWVENAPDVPVTEGAGE